MSEETVTEAQLDLEEVRADRDAFATVAWALHRGGDSERALPYLERALELGSSSRLLGRGAQIYDTLGRKVRARQLRQRARAMLAAAESPPPSPHKNPRPSE